MKTETVYFSNLGLSIDYVIGQNANENFDIIDKANSNDLWFHAKDYSSAHVISTNIDTINKKNLKYIIKRGGLLCKQYTNKIKSMKNVEVIWTDINNVSKTETLGTVNTHNTKTIIV
jgi:predicted ribosome quality control (RQC) complex YloA/Tae2 family protein